MAIKDKETQIHNLNDNFNIGNFNISFPNLTEDIKVVFMGTPTFAVPVLEKLIDNYNVVLVVCQPDRNKDRKGKVIIPPIKELALKHNIEVFQPLKLKEDYQKIIDAKPDIIITCAYGQIVPKIILDYPQYGCINVHGSLLPELRGGAPIHWAIIRGYKETGITIMHMSEKMDAGDIISQEKIEITDDTTLDSLYHDMSILGSELLVKSLPNIINGSADRIKQDEKLVTFGYNISKEDELIDFNKNPREIFNLVRGLNSIPGAYCIFNDKRMKIYKVEPVNKKVNNEPGTIFEVDNNSFKVACKDGYINVLEIAIEGKKRCTVHDYFNGINKNSLIGSVLNGKKE